jgi:hypothetical protein
MWLPDPTPDQVAPPAVVREEARDEAKPAEKVEQSPSIAARANDWMDMMAPPPSEYPNGGWMSNLSAPSAEPAASHAEPKAKEDENRSEASSGNHSGIAEPARHGEETSEDESANGHGSRFGSDWDSEDRFFADAPEPAKPSYHFPSESRDAEKRAEEHAPAAEASSPSDFDNQPMVAPADSEGRDEPAADRTAPEPLLVDEDHSTPSDYSPRQEESSPTQHFLPAPEEAQRAQSDSDLEHLDPSVFEPAVPEPAVEEFSERIPTLPPPNREALSGIAFLMPPRVQVDTTPSEPSAEAVDALVQKVLEKLRPQLQDLFSQGVKPLVESLVHSELTKKDR